jgi:hypothetical protein
MSFRSTGVLAVSLALTLAGGCAESTVPAEVVYHPTLVGVSPVQFLGDVPCVPAAGAMRVYVATVFNTEYLPDGSAVTADDVANGDAVIGSPNLTSTAAATNGADTANGGAGPASADATSGGAGGQGNGETLVCDANALPGTTPRAIVGFALPSTEPIDCTNPSTVARVVDGHRYRAEIDGYDRADLVPLVAGGRILVDPNTGERVTPRWQFSCGDDCPEHAHIALTRAVGNCRLLDGVPPSGEAKVIIPADAFTGVSCGSEQGQVERVEVQYDATNVSGTCGEQIELDGVPLRGTLTLSVLAYEAGNPDPRWGTTCTATPVAGIAVPATCAPLHDEGALDVNPSDALAALGQSCGALATLPGELALALVSDDPMLSCTTQSCMPRYVDSTSCGQRVRFSGVTSGAAAVMATLSSGTTELGRARCSATVVPGSNVTAVCSMEP